MDIFGLGYFFWTYVWRSTMTHFTKLATGLTGLAALAAVSSPAAAQMNPYGYGSNGGVVGAIVNAVTGYGQYPQGNYGYEQMGQRNSVEMCARTAEQRLNSDGRYAGYNNRYGQTGYNDGYGQNGYRNGGAFRVVGITSVERRTNGALKVRGIASSGFGYGTDGRNYQRGDDNRYGNANGYSYPDNGYRNAGMEYRFSCKIDWRGAVTSLDFDRGTRSRRG
jgi:hypothetical protein